MDKIEKLKHDISDGNPYLDIIREFGLINDLTLPTLYGDERKYMLADRNELGVYQTPVQFAELLKLIETIDIRSYLEVGVFRGGTFLFMKYLIEQTNFDVWFNCIDPTDNIHPSAKKEIEPYLIKGVVSDALKGVRYDCVFIDGDHSYDWVKRDFENVGKYAKICILHDIAEPTCPGVVKFWNEIKGNGVSYEFIETLGGYKHQGIGVLINA